LIKQKNRPKLSDKWCFITEPTEHNLENIIIYFSVKITSSSWI